MAQDQLQPVPVRDGPAGNAGGRRRALRQFLLAALVLLLLLGAVYYFVDRATAIPPNYSFVEDGLYVGGSVDKPPPGTKAVLNLCEFRDSYKVDVEEWKKIRDAAPAPSLDWLRDRVAFIEAQRGADRTVYVHCLAGVSRGPMVTIAYLMRRHGWSRDKALAFVRDKRPEIRPNPAFMELLLEWEKAQSKPPAR
ncbi:MAG: dual specificity protein phosphatase [Gemmataceae bacterium]